MPRKDHHHPDGPAADRVDVSADGTAPLELPPPPPVAAPAAVEAGAAANELPEGFMPL